MIKTSALTYDLGQVGDSNLTSRIDYPSGSAVTSDQRETDTLYDWRDRPVLTKQGVQATEDTVTHRPIFYTEYDNLSEVTFSERYDGDQQSLTNWPSTVGVPNRPSAGLLRAKTTPQYDNQGRVFESNVYSVDQTSGVPSTNSLKTDYWFDHRGNPIKMAAPGGLVTKTTYDGVNRPLVVYTTDGQELNQTGSSWDKAQTLAGDTVVTQTENTYDANGNVTLLTRRDRFHDATALGALQNPNTNPKARVSFIGSFFDKADRLTDREDIGTNAGQACSLPSCPPAPNRSDTLLVSSYGYKADQVVQVAIGGSPTGGSFTLTFNGNTATIAFNAAGIDVQNALQGLPSVGSNNALVNGPAGGPTKPGGPWLVRFVAGKGEQALADMTGDGSGLTGCTGGCTLSVITQSRGGDSGRTQTMTDPRGLISKTDYDLRGQTLRTTANFLAFEPTDGSDAQTELTYDGSGQVLTRTAKLANSTLEKTKYAYGVTRDSSCNTNANNCLNSNDLLASIHYPGGSVIANETCAYNALGQTKTKTDRNGSTHQYTFDVLGRQTKDAVTR
jgi:YD repeat-containing protein